jgi:hypothetical protein
MPSYEKGRKAANNVHVLGWMVVGLGLLVGGLVIVFAAVGAVSRTFQPMGLPFLIPSLALILLGSIAILLAHVSRAAFDIADRRGA